VTKRCPGLSNVLSIENIAASGSAHAVERQKGRSDSPKVLRFSIDINSSVLGSLWAKCVCCEVKCVRRVLFATCISCLGC
jgi:hypothetical protein